MPKDENLQQMGNNWYRLFNFFQQEHNLTLLDSELYDIIYEVEQYLSSSGKPASPEYFKGFHSRDAEVEQLKKVIEKSYILSDENKAWITETLSPFAEQNLKQQVQELKESNKALNRLIADLVIKKHLT